MGAVTVLQYTSIYKDIAVIACDSPYASLKDLVE